MSSWALRRARLRGHPLGRALLWSLSLLYGAAVLTRRLAYDLGLAKSQSLPARVVCIGNLTTGGTGKTPAVLLAAQTLRKHHHSVAILSRGFGRRKTGSEVLVLNDEAQLPWTEVGDEPWMMQQALAGQGIPILVCGDRSRAGRQASTFFHSRILVLDDGFQHRKLKRELDVVLVNSTNPFGGRRLLPLGDLREPISSLARADLIMLTHVDLVDEKKVHLLRREIEGINPRAAILESVHKADFLLEVDSGKKHKLEHLKGREVCAFCGLADPESFEKQLEKSGLLPTAKWRYPDHHRYSLEEIRSLERLRHGRAVVTTFKDFTRLPQGWRRELSGEVYALAIKLDIVKGRNIWTEKLMALAGQSA